MKKIFLAVMAALMTVGCAGPIVKKESASRVASSEHYEISIPQVPVLANTAKAQDEWQITAVQIDNNICGNTRFVLFIDDVRFPDYFAFVCIPREKIEGLAFDLGASNSDLAGRTFSQEVATKSPEAKELVGDLKDFRKSVKIISEKR